MNTNQLPPELVEKFEIVIDEFDDSESIFRILHLKTKCAKIAVDYAQEWNDHYHIEKAVNAELRKQRDELLKALTSVVKAGHEFNSQYGGSESLSLELHKSSQLIKKYRKLL